MQIRRERDREKRRTKKVQEEKKRSSETEDHEKQHLATLKIKRLKRGVENELERKQRLEKVVASKQVRLAVETGEERGARLENNAELTIRLSLAMETDEERKARLEKISYHTAQVGPGDREQKKINGIGLDLIWIEIGVFFGVFFFQGMSLLAL